MEQLDFEKLVEERVNKIRQVLANKAKEYARGDRLSNFKKAAYALSSTPEEVCVNLWFKHVISIVDLVQDLGKGNIATDAMWNEKLTDGINYLILLEALVTDRVNGIAGLLASPPVEKK